MLAKYFIDCLKLCLSKYKWKLVTFIFLASGVEVEDARNEEERKMIEDANSWLNKNKMEEVLDWQGTVNFTQFVFDVAVIYYNHVFIHICISVFVGATSLHVAASKGYSKVIR